MKALFIFLHVICLGGICFGDKVGFNKDHGPFEDGEWPEVIKLGKCVETKSPYSRPFEAKFFYDIEGKEGGRRLCLVKYKDWRGPWIYVEDGEGKVLAGPMAMPIFGPVGSRGYHGDLNGDGKEDFVLKTNVGGCGSIFTYSAYVTFVLSDGDGYSVTSTWGLWSGSDYFVDLKGDGRCWFIQTRFVDGSDVKGRDGRSHNYWVYNLLEIRGGKAVLNNEADRRFYKWVWYTHSPNHTETSQISSADKKMLWSEPEYDPVFSPAIQDPVEEIVAGMEGRYEGFDILIRWDPHKGRYGYKIPGFCSLPDDDPYVTARGAEKGQVRMVNEGNKRLREYFIRREDLLAVVDVYLGDNVVEDYHFVFTKDKYIAIHRSNANGGIFSVCRVFMLPYPRTGFEYMDVSGIDSWTSGLLYPVYLFYQSRVLPLLEVDG